MRRSHSLLVLALVLGSTALAGAAEVELIRVWPAWRDADYFERIGHFFGRPIEEASGREVVVRTQGSIAEGFYFLVRLKSPTAVGAAKFEVSVIRPDTLKPVVFAFPVTLPAAETVYQLGLTGSAWPDGKRAHPVAWKLVLKAGDGRVLAEQKSFLWEKPVK
jgi:hypothetical protein